MRTLPVRILLQKLRSGLQFDEEEIVQVTRMAAAAAVTLTMLVGGTACSRAKNQAPSESQVTGDARTPNVPITVVGCLRAGDLADTYVLTKDAAAAGAQETANYQLVGADGVDLGKHIGERVQVNGVLASQQEVGTSSTPAAAKNKPTGTAGQPTVQTETQIDVRTLQVKSINPQGGKCDMK
jgi:hypothetical protein